MNATASRTNLADYYAKRAAEYERIYAKPERQNDLARLAQVIPETLAGRHVLEIACGTGYWTERVAPLATSVLATDINEEVLDVARNKAMPPSVTFECVDVYEQTPRHPPHDAGLAMFWWSHVERGNLPRFLDHFHGLLASNALVVFMDNCYVEGSSTPVARTDPSGDTWQLRTLDDGSTHEVLKNFTTRSELESLLTPRTKELDITFLDYFWYASYRLP